MPITVKPKPPAKPGPKPKTGNTVVIKEIESDYDDHDDNKPVQLTAKPVTAKVTKEYKDGTHTEELVGLGVKKFTGPTSNVGMSVGVTRNLGNYESVKFTVSLNMPCDNDEDSLNTTFDYVRNWVDARVEAVNQEISEQLGH